MQSLSEAFKTRYIKLIEAVTLLWQVLGLSIARLVGFEVVCPRILSHIPQSRSSHANSSREATDCFCQFTFRRR